MPHVEVLRPRSPVVRPIRVALAAVLAILLVGVLAVAGSAATPRSGAPAPASLASASTTPGATDSPTATSPASAATGTSGPDERAVVFVGTAGLRWDDVTEADTPTLWALAHEGSLGDLAVRSVRRLACPADGWLAVSAGKRAADLPADDGSCRTLEEPGAGAIVPGWADYAAAAAESTYDTRLGTLGAAVLAGGVDAYGFGPGAAIALADLAGMPVGRQVAVPSDPARLETGVGEALVGIPGDASGTASDDAPGVLVVVDAGTARDARRETSARPIVTPSPTPTDDSAAFPQATMFPQATITPTPIPIDPIADAQARLDQVQAVDANLAAVLAAVEASGRDATVLVGSLADSGLAPRLQLVAALGPGIKEGSPDFGGSLLGSRSTRQDGIVQTTDLTPSILTALGLTDLVPSGTLVGSPVEAVAPGPGATNLAAVLDIELHAVAIQPLIPPFFAFLVFVNLTFYLIVTIGLNGQRVARLRAISAIDASAVLRGLAIAGVSIASIPVSTYLANALPWWRTGAPGWTLAGLVIAIIAVITLVTLVPRWGRRTETPIVVVAGLTMAVLCYDAATGGKLQVSALMGAPPTVAGRFYGLNNQAFALLATASVLIAVVASDPLVRAGRRHAAAVVIGAIGIFVTVLDGMPGLGSDFGGPPVLVPGFALMVLMALGIRLTWVRVAGVLGAGAVVVIGFAMMDWLRPEDQRTHLGRFVGTVLDGGLWDVVVRKLNQNLANLGGTWLTLLALGGIALVVLVLLRPVRSVANAPDGGPYGWLSGGAPLRLLGATSPMLGPGLITLGVVLSLGFALNDSGIVIPAIGVSLAVPLLVAVCANWMLEMRAGVGVGVEQAGRVVPAAAADDADAAGSTLSS